MVARTVQQSEAVEVENAGQDDTVNIVNRGDFRIGPLAC